MGRTGWLDASVSFFDHCRFFYAQRAAKKFSCVNINEEYPAMLFQGPHHADLLPQ